MKKIIIPLMLVCIAVVSCNKNEAPGISVSPSSSSVTTEGGTVTANVTAGGAWTASCSTEGVSISPASAAGDSPVSITVPANVTGSSRDIAVAFICKEGGNKCDLVIKQTYSEEKISLKVSFTRKDDFDFAGGVDTATVESNYAWTGSITSPAKMSVEKGEKGTTQVIVTIPKNEGKDAVTYGLTFSIKTPGGSEYKVTYSYEQMAPYVKYADVYYKIVKMKDGNYWMAENLRYVPAGMTPSSDLKNVTAGIYYPVKLNAAHDAVEFTTDTTVIKENGYFYQTEVALGLKVGDITTESQAKGLEGVRGICPEGWHIPTATEIINLVGKAVSPYEIKTDAPYYDAEKGNATIEKLNKDEFNAAAWGAVTIQDNTKTAATLMGFLSKYPDIISSGYICGSTYTSKTEKDSKITNFQFLGFMPMANNGTFNGAKLSYRIGANVRCVKDVKKK